MADLRIGVYPGTFDPITTGHLDIIHRACRVVDRLVIGVAHNAGKGPLFSVDERVAMVEAEVAPLAPLASGGIAVKSFASLLMHFVEEQGARFIIRGLRAVSDFEYEFQMAGMNAKLNPKVETIFLMAADGQQFVASRLVKEIGRLGGDITRFVGAHTAERLKARFAEERDGAVAGVATKQTPPFG